jgi:hypothetical protein
MPKKRPKGKASSGRSKAAAKPRTSTRAEEAAYIASLVAHGQAAPAGPDGKLPPGATHELSIGPDRKLKVTRKRFSAF